MQPTQKENHDDSSKDYQNTRKTHIFFGVEDERGTHPQPPMPNAIASVERVIVCKLSTLTQRPNQAVQAACHHQDEGKQADAVPQWTIVKSKRGES